MPKKRARSKKRAKANNTMSASETINYEATKVSEKNKKKKGIPSNADSILYGTTPTRRRKALKKQRNKEKIKNRINLKEGTEKHHEKEALSLMVKFYLMNDNEPSTASMLRAGMKKYQWLVNKNLKKYSKSTTSNNPIFLKRGKHFLLNDFTNYQLTKDAKGFIFAKGNKYLQTSQPDERHNLFNDTSIIEEEVRPIKKNINRLELKAFYPKDKSGKKNSDILIDPNDLYQKSEAAKEKTKEASKIHEDTLEVLSKYLIELGYEMLWNGHIDAYAELKDSNAIFEVKSIENENEKSQIRSGISQLYEYRFFHDIENASLWLLLSSKPSDKWIYYIRKDRNINLLWIENNTLSGYDIDKIE